MTNDISAKNAPADGRAKSLIKANASLRYLTENLTLVARYSGKNSLDCH